MVEELAVCPDCGTRPEEWVPKDGGHLQAYIPETFTCLGCKAKGDLLDSTIDDARKLKQSVRGIKVRLLDRIAFRKKAAESRERRKQEYKEYRESGGRTVAREKIIDANTPPPVTVPGGRKSLASPQKPSESTRQ